MKTMVNYIQKINESESVADVSFWVRQALDLSHSNDEIKGCIDEIQKAAEDKHLELTKEKYKQRFA